MISKERRALLNEVLRRASRSIHDYNYISLSMESWNSTTYGDPTCIMACASPLARLRLSSSLPQVESARWQNFADCFARGPPLRHWRRKGGDIICASERIAPMSYMPEQQVQNWACEFRRARVTEALLDKTTSSRQRSNAFISLCGRRSAFLAHAVRQADTSSRTHTLSFSPF